MGLNDMKQGPVRCLKKDHYKISIRSLTNMSVFELVDPNKTKGVEETDLRNSEHATSDISTFLNVLKSSLGSGLLAMPNAFSNAGLLVGVLGTFLVGLVCAHCTYILISQLDGNSSRRFLKGGGFPLYDLAATQGSLLILSKVKSSQTLCYHFKRSHCNYPETTEAAFQFALKGRFIKYAKLARHITNVCILFPYYGAGIIYVLMAAATFKQVLETYSGSEYSLRWWILLMAAPLLLVGCIRQMRLMAPFSATANLFLLIAVLSTLYYTLQDMPGVSSRPLSVEIYRFPLFICTVLFNMEGIGVILPIENAMKNPKHFLGVTGILNRAMAIVLAVSLVMGVFGYVKYGDDAEGSITLNLPNTLLAELVKVLVGLSILCTYGLQTMAVAEVLWKGLKPLVPEKKETFAYYSMRVAMVISHVLVAIAVPQLECVISLVGAVGLSILGLALPAVLETLTCWSEGLGWWRWRLWKNILLVLMAVLTLVSGTWVSGRRILDTYRAPPDQV